MFFLVVHAALFAAACAFARLYRTSAKRTLLYAAILLACAMLATAIGLMFLGTDRSVRQIAEKLSAPMRWRNFTAKYIASVLAAEAGLLCLAKALRPRLRASAAGRARESLPKAAAGAACTAIALFFFTGTMWAKGRFPMNSPATVYFTLLNSAGHAGAGIYAELAAIAIAALLAGAALPVLHRAVPRLSRLTHLSLRAGGERLIPLGTLFPACAAALMAFSLWWTWRSLGVPQYLALIREERAESVDSAFYREEYVAPDSAAITFPEQKRNLVVILMESMESSFASREDGGLFARSLIPGLTEIAREETSFSHTDKLGGGYDAAGTGWTVAAMLAKFGGLPYNIPGTGNESALRTFMPNAVTLTDILGRNGYRQRFICGSDKHFASRDVLMESHGGVEVHDLAWYKEQGRLPQGYGVFWGFEDEKLYAFAREELAELAAGEHPFMLTLLTVDTHMPRGYLCRLCPRDEKEQMRNVIRCADRQAADFVRWLQGQDWYADTAVVIMGDHRFMSTQRTDFFEQEDVWRRQSGKAATGASQGNPRRWLDIFINAAPPAKGSGDPYHGRTFASFDMFPTILAAMGCAVEGGRLGFGTDLFSGAPTLAERYGEQYINTELMRKNDQYRALMGASAF